MGTTVLNASATSATAGALDPEVRAYAHCGAPPSAHAAATAKGATNPLGMILININVTVP
jgi:hypothetical protein